MRARAGDLGFVRCHLISSHLENPGPLRPESFLPQLHIDEEAAVLTQTQVGSDGAGWLSFQPLYAWIARAEPDLFD